MNISAIISLIAELEIISHLKNYLQGKRNIRRALYSAILDARRETFFYIREYLNQDKFNIEIEKKIAEMWDIASVEALELSTVACDLCRQISEMFQRGSSIVSNIKESIDKVLVDFDNGRANVVVDIVNDKILFVDNDFALLSLQPDSIDMVGSKIDIPDKTIFLSVGMPDIKSFLQVKSVDFSMNRDDHNAMIAETVKAIDSIAIAKVVDNDLAMSNKVKKDYVIQQTSAGLNKKWK